MPLQDARCTAIGMADMEGRDIASLFGRCYRHTSWPENTIDNCSCCASSRIDHGTVRENDHRQMVPDSLITEREARRVSVYHSHEPLDILFYDEACMRPDRTYCFSPTFQPTRGGLDT